MVSLDRFRSDEIVSQLSQALFDGRLQPGQASGIVEIGMGPKGGARIAQGDPKRFAHALAVQLRLVGVTAGEVLDVRVGVEWMGAHLAAVNAQPDELDEISALLEEAKRAREPERVGELGHAFHVLVAAASHNRVLVATLTTGWRAYAGRYTAAARMLAPPLKPMSMDLYAILEVQRSASARQVRSAHRRLARAYHPDRNADDDAADRFKRVAEAYAVLSDTSRRAEYDQWGHIATAQAALSNHDDGDFAFE